MKKIVLTSILISFFGCSETNTFNKLNEIEVSFSSNHKMMSNKEQIREAFIELLLDESSKKEYLQNQLYQNSWVYAFQSKRKWPNKYELKIKEHQPIAKWQEGKFITQSGVLINPENKIKEIELITLIGLEDEKYELPFPGIIVKKTRGIKIDIATSKSSWKEAKAEGKEALSTGEKKTQPQPSDDSKIDFKFFFPIDSVMKK